MKVPVSVSSKKRVAKGWVLRRYSKLTRYPDTFEVRSVLGLSTAMVNRWLEDPYFKQQEIAEKLNGRWVWHKAKLLPWLIVALDLTITIESEHSMATNPGGNGELVTPEEARAQLGMPENYSVRLGREKRERIDMKSVPADEEGSDET
jgi:hypothetical protein